MFAEFCGDDFRKPKCPAGISARAKSEVPKTLVQEVASDKPGVRVFGVRSDEHLGYLCRQR